MRKTITTFLRSSELEGLIEDDVGCISMGNLNVIYCSYNMFSYSPVFII